MKNKHTRQTNSKAYLINNVILPFCILFLASCAQKNKETTQVQRVAQQFEEQVVMPLEYGNISEDDSDTEKNAASIQQIEKDAIDLKTILPGIWSVIRQNGQMNNDWKEGGECYITFRIEEKEGIFLYHFTSHLKTLSDTLTILQSDHEIQLTFKGIEWAYQDENVTNTKKPKDITAIFNAKDKNFVIQNYGNAMNDYRKLAEGCEKYLFFEKQSANISELSEADQKLLDGYTTFYMASGDINDDGNQDHILVLQRNTEDKDGPMPGSYNRKVVLVEQTEKTPSYKIAAINNYLVECSQCGGAGVDDPLQGITIKNGYFSIEQLFGACIKDFFVITFKYEKGEFLLQSIGKNTSYCNQLENDEVKMTRIRKKAEDLGEIKFEEFDIATIYDMLRD